MNQALSAVIGVTAVCAAMFASGVALADEVTEQDSEQRAGQNEDNNSVVNSDWSFGLQAAPLIFGLSVKRQVSDQWQVQGVMMPAGNDYAVALRGLRTSTQKKYWQSYFFGGAAMATDGGYNGEDYRDVAITAGLGVEWAWAAKNPSLPPLTWSLELGLGIGEDDVGGSFDSNRNTFLAAGASIHYQFE